MHEKGLKLVMDLVLNHSSDEHAWFQEAQKSKDNPYRDYYFWKDGKDQHPPNNWTSFFSGSAWKLDPATDQYYLHLFTKKQPDLNWDNPKVRAEIHEIVEFWCQKGVDGFRMDVISLISKQPGLPDSHAPEDFGETIKTQYANGPKIHEYLNELNQKVLYKYDVMTVGEGPGIDLDHGLDYVQEDRNELNMIFHFDHMFIDNGLGGKYDPIDFSLPQFKAVFSKWDARLRNKGWGSIFLGNHDFSRMVNRFGNAREFHSESAKLLALLLCTMRGTVYVYQGDEIGMTNVAYPSIDLYNDVETLGAWNTAKARGEDMDEFLHLVHRQSRDNARSPMQWNASQNAGFSKGNPWLPVNDNYKAINVELQEQDPNSILHFYRKMIAVRKQFHTLVYGDYHCLNDDAHDAYFYKRWDDQASFLVLLNFSDKTLPIEIDEDLNAYQSIVSNYDEGFVSEPLLPWEARLLKK
jgi:oligo-1,6-glucosidase